MYRDITKYRGETQTEVGQIVLADEEGHHEHLRFAHCDDGRNVSLDVRKYVDSQRGRSPFKGLTREGFKLFGKDIVEFFAQVRLLEEEYDLEEGELNEAIEKIRSDRAQSV